MKNIPLSYIDDGMSDALMNTKEVARYLDIHEKQVYALIKAGRIPATRVTGKWIFPKHLIDEWIDDRARDSLREARGKCARIEGALLAAGSNDPLLDMLLTSMKSPAQDLYFFTANTGSVGGLKALAQGYTDIAWSHLLDPISGAYNTQSVLSPYLHDLDAVVIHLFNREIGFLIKQKDISIINNLNDIIRLNLRIVNRQAGAGTRILLDALMQKSHIKPDDLQGYDRAVYTHMEVGLAILSGEADTGIASIAVAKLLGLAFIPLTTESFDMILGQATFFARGVQAFLEELKSPPFHKRIDPLGGYDFAGSGSVLHNGN